MIRWSAIRRSLHHHQVPAQAAVVVAGTSHPHHLRHHLRTTRAAAVVALLIIRVAAAAIIRPVATKNQHPHLLNMVINNSDRPKMRNKLVNSRQQRIWVDRKLRNKQTRTGTLEVYETYFYLKNYNASTFLRMVANTWAPNMMRLWRAVL